MNKTNQKQKKSQNHENNGLFPRVIFLTRINDIL